MSNAGQVDGCFGGGCLAFVISAQAPVPVQPADGALDHPAGGHGGKAAAAREPGGRFQAPAAVLPGPLGQGLAVVAGIGQDEIKSLKSLLGQLFQGFLAADPVVFVGRPDMRGQE